MRRLLLRLEVTPATSVPELTTPAQRQFSPRRSKASPAPLSRSRMLPLPLSTCRHGPIHTRPSRAPSLDRCSLAGSPLSHQGPLRDLVSSTRLAPADRSCHVRTTNPIATIDRARAPQVRHSSPLLYVEVLYLFQYFPHPSPPPSGLSLGRVIRRLNRIETVVQSVGLIVELLSTHNPTPARTWIERDPGLTLLGAPQDLRRRRSRRYTACLH